jgi:hypothetical protein
MNQCLSYRVSTPRAGVLMSHYSYIRILLSSHVARDSIVSWLILCRLTLGLPSVIELTISYANR